MSVSELEKHVVVVGASGFGRESLDVLQAMIEQGAPIRIRGVVDDSPSETNLARLEARGVPYLGTIENLLEIAETNMTYVLGIGNPLVRRSLVEIVADHGLQPMTAIHPSAILGVNVEVSPGVVICAGAVVSTNVHLGYHVHINPNATIGHDAVLEDFVSVNPGAVISGEVLVRESTLIGASATILQGLTVGERAVVGACACVTKSVTDDAVVKGIPAR